MANWVVGYPMQTDREIDLMYEAESEKMWEEQNARDDEWDRKLEAVSYLNVAIEKMEAAVKSFVGAVDELEGLPDEYRVGSLNETLEELICDTESLRQKFIKGE